MNPSVVWDNVYCLVRPETCVLPCPPSLPPSQHKPAPINDDDRKLDSDSRCGRKFRGLGGPPPPLLLLPPYPLFPLKWIVKRKRERDIRYFEREPRARGFSVSRLKKRYCVPIRDRVEASLDRSRNSVEAGFWKVKERRET